MQGSTEAVEAAFQADVFAALEYAEQASVTPAVARKRAELLHEFEGYLRSVGATTSLGTCSFQHVLGFLHAQYRAHHSGSRMKGMLSPSTLTNVAETLGTLFVQAGRRKDDNPARDQRIRKYIKSYYTECRNLGFAQLSAPPLSPAKLQSVLAGLEDKLVSLTAPFPHVLLLRDMALFAYLWATQCRVKDTSTIMVDKVFIYGCDQTPAFADVLSKTVPDDASLLLVPMTDKAHHFSRPPSRLLKASEPQAKSAIQLLFRYMMARTWARVPFEGPLFPAAASSAHTFLMNPVSSATVNAAIKQRFKSIGVYANETTYSFKRGSIQADADAGMTPMEISLKSGVLTPKQLEKYLDRGRHVRH